MVILTKCAKITKSSVKFHKGLFVNFLLGIIVFYIQYNQH